jgi:hypothetical protein
LVGGILFGFSNAFFRSTGACGGGPGLAVDSSVLGLPQPIDANATAAAHIQQPSCPTLMQVSPGQMMI